MTSEKNFSSDPLDFFQTSKSQEKILGSPPRQKIEKSHKISGGFAPGPRYNSHVKFWSMKKHKKILTCISLKRYLRGVGMNNHWNHEPEFFWYKKNFRKSQKFLTQRSDPPSSRFFEKISDVIFLRPLSKIVNFESFLNIFNRVTPIENSQFWIIFQHFR